MNNKKAVIAVGALAVAVVAGFISLRGTWPPGQGTEGAIGAANRYSSTQITADDVKLQDADIQAFIQSDVFHKIATNPEFRRMINEQSFRDVAPSAAYQAIVENKAQAQSLANKEFANYLVQPGTVALVTSEAFAKVTKGYNMAEVLQNPKFYELVSQTLEGKPTPAEFASNVTALSKSLPAGFAEYAAKNAGTVMAAMTPSLLEGKDLAINLSGAAELLASPNLGQLLDAKAKPFTQLVTLEAHEELMKSPEIMSMAFQSEQFRNIVNAGQWSALEKGFTTIEQ